MASLIEIRPFNSSALMRRAMLASICDRKWVPTQRRVEGALVNFAACNDQGDQACFVRCLCSDDTGGVIERRRRLVEQFALTKPRLRPGVSRLGIRQEDDAFSGREPANVDP